MTSRTATGAGLGGSACLLRFMVVVDERCAGGAFLGVTTALPLCPEYAALLHACRSRAVSFTSIRMYSAFLHVLGYLLKTDLATPMISLQSPFSRFVSSDALCASFLLLFLLMC